MGNTKIVFLIKSSRILIIGALVQYLIGCSASPNLFVPNKNGDRNYEKAIRYSHKYVEQFMEKTGTIGMAVAVIDSNAVVYSEGFGYSDMDLKKKTVDSTLFRTGTMGKLFTAIAIMQQVEKGKVCLDSSITEYLPEFTIKSRFKESRITIRDLLMHESGLPSDIYNGKILGQRPIPGTDTIYREVVALCANEYLANPPHTAWSYSNIGFALLGCIIERTSKCTFADYIRDSIFTRLGMNHSSVGIDRVREDPTFSKGYFDKTSVEPVYLSRDIPAGDMVTSIADLSRFLRMLLSGGSLEGKYVLSSKSLEQMWKPQNSDIPLDFRKMGLCFFLTNYIGSSLTFIPEKIAAHGGDCPPFHTCLVILPEVKLGVIVMLNSEQGSSIPSEASSGLLEIFYQANKCRKIIEPQSIAEPVVKLSPNRLQELAGYYIAHGAGGYVGNVKAEIKGNELSFDFFGTQVSLIPHSDSTFSIQHKLFGFIPLHQKALRNFRLEFHTVAKHQIVVFFYHSFHIGMIAEKFVPEVPSAEWLNRVGSYEIANDKKVVFTDSISEKYFQSSDFKISYDSTMRILSFDGLPLKILSSDDAVTLGIGRCAGETVRAYKEKNKEYLWYSGYALTRKEQANTKQD